MIINIIGNGPSRDQYTPDDNLTITCHFKDFDADMIATMHMEDYGWQPLPTISTITKRISTADYRMHYPEELVYDKPFKHFTDKYYSEEYTFRNIAVHGLNVFLPVNHKFNSGAVAILWALYTHPEAQIRCWGFDHQWTDKYINFGKQGEHASVIPSTKTASARLFDNPKVHLIRSQDDLSASTLDD